uniref:G-protein coupled receptors family 1 profile domain-containing protein n=1 Tax=Gopherus evgoodei TaxID=1825980 RepID=A0A8C4WI45_9SAUR
MPQNSHSLLDKLRIPLFLFFLIIYLLTLCGNLLIWLAVARERRLHKPLYWFLCYLSFLDMTVSSVVVPKMVAGFLPGGGAIYFQDCVAQIFFFHFLGCTNVIMNHRTCLCLAVVTWLGGSLHSTIQTVLTFQPPYVQENRLACGDTALNELVTFMDIGFLALTCFLHILMSYVYIVSAILRIHSAQGRHRAFSTCMAHITVVVTYYVPGLFIYLRPGSWHPLDGVVAVFYTTVTPLLNPLLYTLKNKEMKDALMRLGGRKLPGPEL